jgi:acyl-CoA thioesterase YciA
MADKTDSFPEDLQPEIRVLAMPADTNASGDIFGGWLMSQVDIAGSILAHQAANGRVVTVAVNEFVFLKPVFVGDLVSIFAELINIGNTSLQIELSAYAERQRGVRGCHRVAHAKMTYVAIDEDRKPRPVKTNCHLPA